MQTIRSLRSVSSSRVTPGAGATLGHGHHMMQQRLEELAWLNEYIKRARCGAELCCARLEVNLFQGPAALTSFSPPSLTLLRQLTRKKKKLCLCIH